MRKPPAIVWENVSARGETSPKTAYNPAGLIASAPIYSLVLVRFILKIPTTEERVHFVFRHCLLTSSTTQAAHGRVPNPFVRSLPPLSEIIGLLNDEFYRVWLVCGFGERSALARDLGCFYHTQL